MDEPVVEAVEGEVLDSNGAIGANANDDEEWPWPHFPRKAVRTRDYAINTHEGGVGGSTPLRGWEGDFLDAFSRTGVIAAACRLSRTNPQTVKNRRSTDALFREAFEEASEIAVDKLEAAAIIRARDGVTRRKGVYFQGERIDEEVITEYSDGLLKFLLEHKRPQVYRETIDVNHNISVMRAEIERIALSQGWDEERKQVAITQALQLMGV